MLTLVRRLFYGNQKAMEAFKLWTDTTRFAFQNDHLGFSMKFRGKKATTVERQNSWLQPSEEIGKSFPLQSNYKSGQN